MTVSLTIAFLILSVTILLFASGLEIYFNFKSQQEMITSEQQLIAQQAANTVKSFIEEKFNILSASVRLSDFINSPKEERELNLDKLLGVEPAFRQLTLFNTEQQQLAEVSRLSKEVSSKFKEHIDSSIFSKLNQEKTYIGSIYIDETTQEPIIILAVPVKDVFGDLKGVLMAEVNLKFMWDLVGRIKIGENGLAYVVDRQGNLIAFGDISRVLKEENLTNLREVSEFINNKERVPTAETSKGIQGTNVVSTFIQLGMPDWAVIIESPVSEAYGAVFQMLRLSLWIILGNFLLAIATGFYLSKRITKPIMSLRDAAKEMSKGKLDTKIEIKSRDEIGELATDFNDMAARLRAYTGELESKVAERTLELDKKLKELLESNTELEKTKSIMLNLIEEALRSSESLQTIVTSPRALRLLATDSAAWNVW